MGKKSDGATGSGKGNWMKQMKAMKAMLEKHGIDTEEGLSTFLEAAVVSPEPEAEPSPLVASEVDDTTVVADDLAWVTEDTFEIHFVVRNIALTLRPARPQLTPQLQPIMLNMIGQGAWDAMPFDLRNQNHAKEKLNRIRYANWGHFVLTRDIAEDVFSDDRFPLPERAVISGKEFRGWSRAARRALGTYRPLDNPDPLRETLRRILQQKARAAFVDARYHQEMPDYRIVNPYGNSLGDLGTKVGTVDPKFFDAKSYA